MYGFVQATEPSAPPAMPFRNTGFSNATTTRGVPSGAGEDVARVRVGQVVGAGVGETRAVPAEGEIVRAVEFYPADLGDEDDLLPPGATRWIDGAHFRRAPRRTVPPFLANAGFAARASHTGIRRARGIGELLLLPSR